MPSWLALGFQDSGSPSMGELFCLHDHVMTIMVSVIVLISYIMVYLLFSGSYYKYLSEGTFIETVWSLVPAFLLIILVLPSMKVLYMVEDVKSPSYTFKVVAHQWYWSYVAPLYGNFSFLSHKSGTVLHFNEYDSFLSADFPRLISSSSDLVMPVDTTSRLLITSTDVIHSFSLPSIGLKVDALPGRINQLFSNPSRVGLFFGQCSEICGSNHSFMPISVKICSLDDFEDLSLFQVTELLGDLFSKES